MPEIIREWVGYNGKLTEEKKPDGSVKKTKHHKIWAVALTNTGHLYVRYGPAKHPLHLTEQIIRPKRGMSEVEALSEAERIFHEKVQEKLTQKGYDAISFASPPHFVPSFSQWRMSDEPEEVVIPVHELVEVVTSLREALDELSELCSTCRTTHQRYLVNIGDGQTYPGAQVTSLLSRTEQGMAWLAAPCLRQDNALLHAHTQEVLAMILDAECPEKNSL